MTQMPPSLLDPPETGANSERIERQFPSLHLARSSRFARRLGKLLVTLMSVASFAAFAVPWQQSIRGEGAVVAFDPFERPQWVQSQVKGRIVRRGEKVLENAYVEKGDFLFTVENPDPDYLNRLMLQENAARADLEFARERVAHAEDNLEAAKDNVRSTEQQLVAWGLARDAQLRAEETGVQMARVDLTAKEFDLNAKNAELWLTDADNKRKQELLPDGLVSGKVAQEASFKFQKAEANVEVAKKAVENAQKAVDAKLEQLEAKRQEWLGKISEVQGKLDKARQDVAKAEENVQKVKGEVQQKESKLEDQKNKVRVQETQDVTAPISGYIHGLDVFDGQPVKEQQKLCRIVPEMTNPAVQVWVAGNDQTFIQPGRHVRLQFEGWPAVQFSGWPSVAVGTFGGEVASVDATDNGMGRFRVLIVPDETDTPWPEHPYLRQGVRTNGWVLLDQVPLGFELWRRMNGFPPALDEKTSESSKSKPPKIKI